MAKRSPPGNSVVRRIARRDEVGLRRRQMPGGGEYFTGPIATRAVRALGARAFTMDRSIFVAEDFDPNDPEDQALYAHERHHQINSGGDGAARSYYDQEERAARAVERMVLHRAATGEDFGSLLRSIDSGRVQTEGDVTRMVARSANPTAKNAKGGKGPEDPAANALAALLKSGKSEEAIVRDLVDACIEALNQQREEAKMRGGSVGFL